MADQLVDELRMASRFPRNASSRQLAIDLFGIETIGQQWCRFLG